MPSHYGTHGKRSRNMTKKINRPKKNKNKKNKK